MTRSRDRCAEARRPRLSQALRRIPRRDAAQGASDRHPRQDQEGLRHGRGRRIADDGRTSRRSSTSRRCWNFAIASRCRSPMRTSTALAFSAAGGDQPEMAYLRERRAALGGALPARRRRSDTVAVPALASVRAVRAARPKARKCRRRWPPCDCSSGLLKDKTLGPRIVPIVADEARTFGMASLFRQIGIYSPFGQQYEPEDAGSMLYYREARDGQLLEEGITEAGALASWTAAATSYSVHGAADAAVLHLLLDVRIPARRRPDLGRGRPARARLPARRDRRTHDARRRGTAASGRQQPRDRRDCAQLPRLRSGVRVRARGDRRSRHAQDDGAARRRVLLRHRDERELRAAVAARGCRRRRDQGHVPAAIVAALPRTGARCGCSAAARSCAK